MAFRFQRRIKIAKGLHLNLSKSGLGISAGVRGANVSVGPKGIFGNTGIPGTGLSYRNKLSSNKQVKQKSSLSNEAGQKSISVKGLIEDDGQLKFYNADTLEDLTSSEMQYLKRHYSDSLAEMVQALCDDKNKNINKITTVHHTLPPPQDQPMFIERKYSQTSPEEPKYTKIGLLALIWPPLKTKIQSQNASLKSSYEITLQLYHEDKKAFENSETLRKKRETIDVLDDIEAMSDVLEHYLSIIDWPYETEIDFDFGDDYTTLAVDVCLPTEDKLPTSRYQALKSLSKVSIKPVNATTKRALYRDHVHAIALRIIAEIFHRLPSLKNITLSGYIEGQDIATGHHEDQYLLSVKVDREQWKNINFEAPDAIDPLAALEQFELVRNMTKTGIFKAIEPKSIGSECLI